MNKIVREHYPVANLPEDLRKEFGDVGTVTLTIEPEIAADDFWSRPLHDVKPRTPQQFRNDLAKLRAADRPSVSPEQAVKEIRALRDDWDDE